MAARFPGPMTGHRPCLDDVVAGLSVAGLLLPEAVAYAGIANMPPQAGVVALFVGLLVYGLLGGSRFAIVSATSSSAAVLLAASAGLSGGDMALRLLAASGLVVCVGGLLLLGALVNAGSATAFIARPVLRGFAFGLALLIMARQWPLLVGQPWHGPSACVGLGALALLWALSRVRGLPSALLVMVLGVATQHLFGVERLGVGLIGPMHLDWGWPAWPALAWAQWLRLGELAVALVLILYAESNGSIRSLAVQHGDPIRANRDLLALGLANVLSGLFHGMPVGAGYSATMVNEAAGARSRWAGLIAAGVVAGLIAVLLPWVSDMPKPVLAAIVIHALGHTLNPAAFRPYFVWRRDRLLSVAAVVLVLVLGVLDGLLAAMGISLFMTLRGLAQARVSELGRLREGHDFVDVSRVPEAVTPAGLLILRPEAPLFFGNVDRLLQQVKARLVQAGPGVQLILSLEESPDLDGTALEALRELASTLSAEGSRLIFGRLKHPAYLALQRAALPGCLLSMLSIDEAVHLAGTVPRSSEVPSD